MPYIEIKGRLINLDNFDEIDFKFDRYYSCIILRKMFYAPRFSEERYGKLIIYFDSNVEYNEIKKNTKSSKW